MKRNLIMWDPETNSLWSQIQGRGIHGAMKGKTLDMLPAVFVGYGTWKKMHPKTEVLDLSGVRFKGWYYTIENLARGVNDQKAPLGIGLRQKGRTLLITMKALHQKPVYNVVVAGTSLVVVWDGAEKAVLTYQAPSRSSHFTLRAGMLHDDTTGIDYSILHGKAGNSSRRLKRFPCIPTLVKAWKSYYPEGRTIARP